MSEPGASFGARYAALEGVEARAALEATEGRRERFADVDAVLDRLILGALRGDLVASCPVPSEKDVQRVELAVPLSDAEREAVAEHFSVGQQERRGAWYVPENETLSLGLIHAVHLSRQVPRFVLTAADAERANPPFRDQPQAVATWVLEPLFEQLFLPFKLRSGKWLGSDSGALAPFRPRSGWSTLDTDAVIAQRVALFEAWAQAPNDVGARYRAYRVGEIADRYYAKAKGGRALRKSVMTKAQGRTLTAYFGGDWLAFLEYLGEEPHDGEEIVQTLPETKLMVGTSERTAEVAAAHGVPTAEIQKMLASYWEQSDHDSPVDHRVRVLKRFWDEFDAIHARQESGMSSLWGLVDWGGVAAFGSDDTQYRPHQTAALLSAELNEDIQRYWGSTVLTKWPDRIVSEPSPRGQLAKAFGPALSFWQEAALTAWFLCEGPYARSSMAGLRDVHERQLEELQELGCPIPPSLFTELRAAETTLRPKPREPEDVSEVDVGSGFSITIETSFGNELLEGFETLRDIITRHRREWAAEYMDKYLRTRWEQPLRAAGEAYNRLAAQRAKPPTVKQFAKAGVEPANLWFGGSLATVYSVLGLKSPVTMKESHLLPADAADFVQQLYRHFGGEPRNDNPVAETREQMAELRRRTETNASASGLARLALSYVQAREALGRPPELKEVGRSKFENQAGVLAENVDEAWEKYGAAVGELLNASTSRGGSARTIEPGDERSGPSVTETSSTSVVHGLRDPATAGTVESATTTAQVAGRSSDSHPLPDAGWYADPSGQHSWRWWDGQQWTDHVG